VTKTRDAKKGGKLSSGAKESGDGESRSIGDCANLHKNVVGDRKRRQGTGNCEESNLFGGKGESKAPKRNIIQNGKHIL